MKNAKHQTPLMARDEPTDKKQIHMTIDGCKVRLNIPANNNETTKLESVKRMILSGLARV